MIEKILSGEEDEWGVADRRVKPALLTLLYDQAALIDSEHSRTERDFTIRTGFPDRRTMIEWYQRAAIRTLGKIEKKWSPQDCISDEVLVASMVNRPPDTVEPINPFVAAEYRNLVETNILIPACNEAFKQLRASASEYIRNPNEEETDTPQTLDPTKQKHVAMRPGFQSLDDQQQATLEELWGGFESRDDLNSWLHSLNSPTNGEIRDDIAESVVVDEYAMEHLLHEPDTDRARAYRELFAVTELLPAFIEGVNSIETGELAKPATDGPTTFRAKGSE